MQINEFSDRIYKIGMEIDRQLSAQAIQEMLDRLYIHQKPVNPARDYLLNDLSQASAAHLRDFITGARILYPGCAMVMEKFNKVIGKEKTFIRQKEQIEAIIAGARL